MPSHKEEETMPVKKLNEGVVKSSSFDTELLFDMVTMTIGQLASASQKQSPHNTNIVLSLRAISFITHFHLSLANHFQYSIQ